jgi:hypothetical protein
MRGRSNVVTGWEGEEGEVNMRRVWMRSGRKNSFGETNQL